MKLSGFIIGTAIIVFIMTVFTLFIGNGLNGSSDVSGFNQSEFEDFNKMAELENVTNEMQKGLTNTTAEKVGKLDIIGGYITTGLKAGKVGAKSVETFTSISNTGIDKLGLGGITGILKALTMFILMAFGAFILLKIMLKIDL